MTARTLNREAGSFKAEHSVLFQIKIDYEDGTSEMVVSDDAVKVSESPVFRSVCR